MRESLVAVTDFHRKVNAPVATHPILLSGNRQTAANVATQLEELARSTASLAGGDVLLSRCALAIEELGEWLTAHAEADLVAAADAWADRANVLLGDGVAAGLPAEALFNEVHRSNITKQPDTAGTGKAIKGDLYEPPNLFSLLNTSHDSLP